MKKFVVCGLVVMFTCLLFWVLPPPCYNICRAYALKRNPIFYTLVKTVSEQKNKSPNVPVVIEQSVISQKLMDQFFVQYWGVTASGTIFMASKQDRLLVAEPKTVNGVTTWTCTFYPEPVPSTLPLCDSLKY